MNKILKLTIVLFLVCAIVAGVLGVVNELTKDTIAEQQRIKTERAYAAVLASDGYTEVAFDKAAFPSIDAISECTNGAGHVVMTTFTGAQGKITMAVGVDTDYKCTGISIISHSETSGLGSKATDPEWQAQFAGITDTVTVTKDGGQINAITGSTITSRSVAEAAANAISVVESLG